MKGVCLKCKASGSYTVLWGPNYCLSMYNLISQPQWEELILWCSPTWEVSPEQALLWVLLFVCRIPKREQTCSLHSSTLGFCHCKWVRCDMTRPEKLDVNLHFWICLLLHMIHLGYAAPFVVLFLLFKFGNDAKFLYFFNQCVLFGDIYCIIYWCVYQYILICITLTHKNT